MDNSMYESIELIKNMIITKSPNIIYKFDETIPNYNYIIELWKKYITGKNLIIPDKYSKIIKEIFKFHLNKINHVIIFQSNNLNTSLIMSRINLKFYNIIVPKIQVSNNITFIGVYTE